MRNTPGLPHLDSEVSGRRLSPSRSLHCGVRLWRCRSAALAPVVFSATVGCESYDGIPEAYADVAAEGDSVLIHGHDLLAVDPVRSRALALDRLHSEFVIIDFEPIPMLTLGNLGTVPRVRMRHLGWGDTTPLLLGAPDAPQSKELKSIRDENGQTYTFGADGTSLIVHLDRGSYRIPLDAGLIDHASPILAQSAPETRPGSNTDGCHDFRLAVVSAVEANLVGFRGTPDGDGNGEPTRQGAERRSCRFVCADGACLRGYEVGPYVVPSELGQTVREVNTDRLLLWEDAVRCEALVDPPARLACNRLLNWEDPLRCEALVDPAARLTCVSDAYIDEPPPSDRKPVARVAGDWYVSGRHSDEWFGGFLVRYRPRWFDKVLIPYQLSTLDHIYYQVMGGFPDDGTPQRPPVGPFAPVCNSIALASVWYEERHAYGVELGYNSAIMVTQLRGRHNQSTCGRSDEDRSR